MLDNKAQLLSMIQEFIPNKRGRRSANLPVLRDGSGAVVPRYLVEKQIGLRRENGALKLKQLTNRHLKMVGMHLEGRSGEAIAITIGCSLATVSRILNDPLSQNILKRVYADRQEEIQSLGGRAIETVRDGLDKEQPIGVRLRAVDRYTRIRDTMLGKGTGEETAEDVIARMLARINISGSNVQINVGKSEDSNG